MDRKQTVYSLGARDGLTMGVYLSVMFVLQAIGVNRFPAALLGLMLMLGIPVITYVMIKRGDRILGYNTFSANWLHGIVMFLCGSMIMAVVMYVYLRFVNTSFIVDQINSVVDIYRQMGTTEANKMANQFEGLIRNKLLPSPIQMAFSAIWFFGFFGSVLSLVLTLIYRSLRRLRPADRR